MPIDTLIECENCGKTYSLDKTEECPKCGMFHGENIDENHNG